MGDIQTEGLTFEKAIMNEEVRKYAHKTGFYVIEQTGDTVKIDIPEGFIPKEWQKKEML